MHGVRPKKFLGQHFLKDHNIALKIVQALSMENANQTIVEIGPGTGVLTNFLLERKFHQLLLIEIDRDSISFLKQKFSDPKIKILEADFLKLDISNIIKSRISIIGNFPYNISSQIFFKILEQINLVDEIVCMVQKEVAERICAIHGNKIYGILSVLLGAYFEREILFKVPPGVFHPPPKVDSAVIRLKRNFAKEITCDKKLFVQIVKQGFQNRRKTLRNALKPIILPLELTKDKIFDKRAEQLSVNEFLELTKTIENWKT